MEGARVNARGMSYLPERLLVGTRSRLAVPAARTCLKSAAPIAVNVTLA